MAAEVLLGRDHLLIWHVVNVSRHRKNPFNGMTFDKIKNSVKSQLKAEITLITIVGNSYYMYIIIYW